MSEKKSIGRPAGTGGIYNKTPGIRYGRPPKYKSEEDRKLAYNELANKRYYKKKCGGTKETRQEQLKKKKEDRIYINKMLITVKEFLEHNIDNKEIIQKVENLCNF